MLIGNWELGIGNWELGIGNWELGLFAFPSKRVCHSGCAVTKDANQHILTPDS
jgi:hypothetical protein